MVKGLDIFKQHFAAFPENYVIIGGTACDIVIEDGGLIPRATKDIDIILIVEALSSEFVASFWKFIAEGNYERKEKSDDDRKYYRFTKPENTAFPHQIELFSRSPDLISLEEGAHLTPIPVDDDLSSLSAILLDDVYYNYMIENSVTESDIHHANTNALMCLKAKAFLEISERIAKGGTEDPKHLNKHKGDVFRLALMLAEGERFELPELIKNHMQTFSDTIADNLPDKNIFKAMGAPGMDAAKVHEQIKQNFGLT